MAQPAVAKIYELRTLGYDSIITQLDNVDKKFLSIAASKRDLNKVKADPAESEAMKKQNAALEEQRLRTVALRTEKAKLLNDAKAENLIRQQTITQEKQAAEAAKTTKAAVDAEAGSYTALVRQQKELYAQLKLASPNSNNIQFNGQNINFEQGIAEYKKLSAAEQEFRRQFTKDGTLVGEYQTGITNALHNSGTAGDKFTSGLSKGFHELKGEVAGFLLTFIGIQQGFQFVEQGIEKFETAERSALRLDTAVKNLGKESDLPILNKNLDELKAKFQFLSIFDLREATQKLVTYGKLSTDQIKQITDLAVNLTAEQGGTVAENSELLIKALEGNARGLKVYGINIKDAATEQGRFDLITQELTKRISGQADAFAKSESGSIERYKQKMAEIQVAVGQKLFPILSALASLLFFVTDNFGTLATAIGTVTVFLLAANAELIIAKAQILGYNLLLGASRIALYTLSIAQAAYNIGLQVYTSVTKVATAVTELFGLSMKALPLGLILTLIGLLAASFKAFGGVVTGTTAALRAQAEVQKFAAETMKEANKAIAQQRSELDTLVAILKDENISQSTKVDTLKKLIEINPAYLSGLTQANLLTKEGIKILQDYNTELQNTADLTAAATIKNRQFEESAKLREIRQEIAAAQKKGGVGFGDLSSDAQDFITGKGFFNAAAGLTNKFFNEELGSDDYVRILGDLNKKITESDNSVIAATQNLVNTQKKSDDDRAAFLKGRETKKETFAIDIPALTEELKQLNEKITNFRGAQNDLDDLIKLRDAAQKKLDLLQNKNQKTYGGAKLSGAEKDKFEEIDAINRRQIATEETRVTEIKKLHELSFDEERTYAANIERINIDALNKKIAILEKQKNLNAKEKATLAEFIKDRADAQLKLITTDKEIDDKDFARRMEVLKNNLDEEIKYIQDRDAAIQRDPTASNTAKAQSKLDADNQILALQVQFAARIDALEKDLGQNSLKNAKAAGDAVHDTKQRILEDDFKLTEAGLKDAQAAGALSLQQFKAQIAAMRLAVADSGKSPQRQAQANQSIDNLEKLGTLSIEVQNMQKQLPIYKKLYEEKKITAEEYLKFITDLEQKQADLQNTVTGNTEKNVEKITTLAGLIKNKLQGLFNFDLGTQKGRDSAALVAETIQKTYDVATQAMQNYFDREAANIKRAQEHSNKLLDIELQQRKDRAQGQAEQDSLDRQYAAKKDKVDRDAFEKNKKLQLAQAKIALAITLANLAVVAFAPSPANIATLGVAGAISYAIQAALAIASYAINTSNIRSAQYGFGGRVDGSTTRGGRVGGRSHAAGGNPFVFKGRTFEDEVDELNIIRTRNAPAGGHYSISGTQSQIASKLNEIGGGVAFDRGAKTGRFAYGGSIGESLQAPIFRPSTGNTYISSGSNDQVLEAIAAHTAAVTDLSEETSQRIDRLEVHLNTNDVSRAQRKQANQKKVGSF